MDDPDHNNMCLVASASTGDAAVWSMHAVFDSLALTHRVAQSQPALSSLQRSLGNIPRWPHPHRRGLIQVAPLVRFGILKKGAQVRSLRTGIAACTLQRSRTGGAHPAQEAENTGEDS